MKSSIVEWSISADVECPHCSGVNDFMDQDGWHEYCQVGENVEVFWRQYEMRCRHCGEEFNVTGSIY